MKCHMKIVKHQLEAKKYTITEETMTNSEVQVILIDNEADLLKAQTDQTGLLIQNINIPQISLIEAFNVQNNKLIPSSTDVPCNVQNSKVDGVNLTNSEAEKTSTTNESCTDDQDEQVSKENSDSDQQDNAKKEAEIETVVESLLEALKEDKSPNTEQDKKKIITQFHHDDDIVDLEINKWLTVDSWGNTPAIKEMIPVNFEDLWTMNIYFQQKSANIYKKEDCNHEFWEDCTNNYLP